MWIDLDEYCSDTYYFSYLLLYKLCVTLHYLSCILYNKSLSLEPLNLFKVRSTKLCVCASNNFNVSILLVYIIFHYSWRDTVQTRQVQDSKMERKSLQGQ